MTGSALHVMPDSKVCWLEFLTSSADHLVVDALRCQSSPSVANGNRSDIFLGNGEESSAETNCIDFFVKLPCQHQVDHVAKSDHEFAI